MSVEVVLPEHVVVNRRKRMGTRWLCRWIALSAICCGLGWYFFSLKIGWSFFLEPKKAYVSDPLLQSIQAEIVARNMVPGRVSVVNSSDMKLVLFYTKFFGAPDSRGELGPQLFSGCPVSSCMTTNDRSRLQDASALIFHALDIPSENLPVPSAKQHFVFFVGEAPANLDNRVAKTPGDYFDMIFSYHLKSDILGHYFYSAPFEMERRNFATGKNKLVAWFSSNCHTKSHREDYVKKLREYVHVDIFGDCSGPGGLKCPRSDESVCNSKLKTEYKFYLAFENSLCKDYVTEKFTRALENDVIPIAMNDADMSQFPPESFIHVRDFPDVKSLADYLLFLDKNGTAYNKYFNWRYDKTLVSSHGRFSPANSGWCQLCERLHDTGYKSKRYPDALERYSELGQCREGSWK